MPLYRPTPPTPPTIDKGEATEYTPKFDAHKFFQNPLQQETEEKPVAQDEKSVEIEKTVETPPPQNVEKKSPTPEQMARDAVANGAGALTKKTVTRPETENDSAPPNTPATQNVPLANVPNDNPNRGKEILREFQNEDRQTFQSVETPRNFNRHQGESYSGIYWAVMIILAGILSFIFVNKFLLKKNPKLKKSELFDDSSKKLKTISDKVSAPVKKPPEKPSAPIKKPPPKKDDDKGKHFEIRV